MPIEEILNSMSKETYKNNSDCTLDSFFQKALEDSKNCEQIGDLILEISSLNVNSVLEIKNQDKEYSIVEKTIMSNSLKIQNRLFKLFTLISEGRK